MIIAIDPLIARIGGALTAREIGWAVAGGWAIDLFLGRVTRPDADLEMAGRGNSAHGCQHPWVAMLRATNG